MHTETEQKDGNQAGDSGQGSRRTDAYPFPLDAVVLAGTHQNLKRLICGRNKAFLEVGGQVLLRYVVNALLEAESIDQIFVVGPPDELLQELAGFPPRVIPSRLSSPRKQIA